jgi:hypothetical protein
MKMLNQKDFIGVSGGDNPGMGPYDAPAPLEFCFTVSSIPGFSGKGLLCVSLQWL